MVNENVPPNSAIATNNTRLYGTNVSSSGVQTKDMETLTRWIRGEMFGEVKFIYQPDEDLRTGGKIYRWYVKSCKESLLGLREIDRTNQDARRKYVEDLWKDATMRKRCLVQDGLASRRSSVYTAMQNRFNGTWLGGMSG